MSIVGNVISICLMMISSLGDMFSQCFKCAKDLRGKTRYRTAGGFYYCEECYLNTL